MKAGSKGSTAIPSDPHRMVSATCPAVATSGRLMILWKNVKQGEGRGGGRISYSVPPESGSEMVQGSPTLL